MGHIPKIIHYVWVGGSSLPARFRRNVRSWRRYNPDFELKLWSDANIDWTEPFLQEARRQRAWAKLSDYVRLLAVERHGGVYLDVDVEACRPFDELLTCECFFGLQSQREQDEPICNAVFGAEPHNAFLRKLIETFPKTTTDDLYHVGTGPELVSALLREQGLPRHFDARLRVDGVDVYPTTAFYPYHWTEEFDPARVSPETFAIHHWDMSWQHARSAPVLRILRAALKSYPAVYRPLRRLARKLPLRREPTS